MSEIQQVPTLQPIYVVEPVAEPVAEPVITPPPRTTYESAITVLKSGANPALLVFDCDWTLYPFDCDKDRVGPFIWQSWHGVVDCYGRPSNSYTDVSSIFAAIIDSEIPVSFLSRNPSAQQVKQLLSVIPCNTKVQTKKNCLLDAMPSETYFHAYSSGGFGKGKDKHFHALKQVSGIPFSDMLFFDDMPDNISAAEVQGTTGVLLGRRGFTLEAFTGGLERWRQKKLTINSAASS